MQLQVASPDKSVVFDVVSAMDHLGNFSLDRDGTNMTIEQGILYCFWGRFECNMWLTKQNARKLPLPDRLAQLVKHQVIVREKAENRKIN